MCHSSLSRGECTSNDCTLRHVHGTKKNYKDEDLSQMPVRGPSLPAIPTKNSQRNRNSNQSDILKHSDFLEQLRLLKLEMIEAMDIKIATLMSTQTASQDTGQRQQLRHVESSLWQEPHPWGINHQNPYMMNQEYRGYPANRF